MESILKFLRKDSAVTMEEFFACLNAVGANGDIFIVKIDGARQYHRYTIVISSPKQMFESIRYDTDDVMEGARKALQDYISVQL